MNQGLSRRQFLHRAASAAAVSAGAIAAPAIIPASARGADGHVAASNRIGVGLIGLGKLGRNTHLKGFLAANQAQVLAVCDVESQRIEWAKEAADKQYAQRFAKGAYKGCDMIRDFRDMLARPDIDAVVIATPNHWHAILAVEACKAGKDVYCEKPLAETIGEAQAMAQAARRYGRIFQTGSQQRSDRTFRFACELVRNGRIGKVHTVYVMVGPPAGECYLPAEPTPKTLDWDMWLGPAPYRPYNAILCPMGDYKEFPKWRVYRDYGGGGMTDFGAHHYDIAQWGLGMDHTGPVEITPPDGKDVQRLTYKYANGVTMFHGGGTIKKASIEWVGTEGRVGVARGQFLYTEPESLKRETFGPSEVHLYESRSHRDNFLECVRTRRQPICTADIGYRTVTVCLLGNLAYWLKRPLKWNPEKEQFVDDAEATRLLRRPMRAPWQV